MIPPDNCPYKGLSAAPCWSCQWHNADIDSCNYRLEITSSSAGTAATMAQPNSFSEKLRQYEEDRKKLLELPKEALVDLILHRPTQYGLCSSMIGSMDSAIAKARENPSEAFKGFFNELDK